MDYSLPGASTHGILQARILQASGLPFPSLGDLPDPGIKLRSPALQAYSLLSESPGTPAISNHQNLGETHRYPPTVGHIINTVIVPCSRIVYGSEKEQSIAIHMDKSCRNVVELKIQMHYT